METRRDFRTVYYRIADKRVQKMLELPHALLADNAEHVAACRRIDGRPCLGTTPRRYGDLIWAAPDNPPGGGRRGSRTPAGPNPGGKSPQPKVVARRVRQTLQR